MTYHLENGGSRGSDPWFPAEVIAVIENLVLWRPPCQAAGIVRSDVGLVSSVSVYCEKASLICDFYLIRKVDLQLLSHGGRASRFLCRFGP